MNVAAAKTPSPHLGRYRESVAICGVAMAIALLVGQLDPGIDLAALARHETMPKILLLNVLPVLTLFALFVALSRRLLLSAWLVLLAVYALYAANGSKLDALQMPLLPADLRILGAPGSALRLFSRYLHPDAMHWLAIASALGITLLLCRERRMSALAGWRAPALGLAALLLSSSLIAGSSPWRRVYRSAAAAFQPWSLAESAAHTGLIGGLLLYHWEIGSGELRAPDRDAAVALLRAHAPALRENLAAATAGELPDIVVVQSESLFDPARLRGVPSGRYLREYRQLAARANAGNLRVPTFAGGTIRTEFEVLTGAPLASLGGLQYPWLELDRDDYPGLARVLGAHGYRSVAIHPNAAAFWNRARAYPALGFDRFVDAAAFAQAPVVGLFTADAALTDRVLAELDDDGPPQLVFAISIENHGPFYWRPGLDPQRLGALPMPQQLDAEARTWLGNYLYLLDDADRELGRLAVALQERKRRSLLLFYGDHLPDLGPVYGRLGFDDGREAQQQPAPWLLFDTAAPYPHARDAHSYMLPALLLRAAGIHDAAYFDILATLADDDSFDADGDGTADGLNALALLQLRGELDAVVATALADDAAAL